MATTMIKNTYSLDVETVRALERMAREWNVSKSEALRRVIRSAEHGERRRKGTGRLSALDRLQQSASITAARARRWEEDVRRERSGASQRSSKGER